MKKVVFLIIWVILIAGLYYGGFLSSILSQAKINSDKVFVASAENISQIATATLGVKSATPKDQTPAKKVFNEFTESTIDPHGFYLRIDKINLFKRIIENVDPREKAEYIDSWNYGISHGKFTSTPDKIGITYLFAHALGDKSEALDANAWFSYLDELERGDEVIVYYKGKKYTYNVSEILFVSPSATGFYTGASPVAKIRMQFCGPPTGSLDSRTLVDAVLIDTKDIV